MTDPVQVVAEAPCVLPIRTCGGTSSASKHPECAVAALQAAGALMPEEAERIKQAVNGERQALITDAALLQEVREVLGRRHIRLSMGSCLTCRCVFPCPEASLLQKIEESFLPTAE